VVCFQPYESASLQEAGGDYTPSAVVGAVAVVVVVVGIGKVFVLEEGEGEDPVAELGGECVEEGGLGLGVTSGEVLPCGACCDADLFGRLLLEVFEPASVVVGPVCGVGRLHRPHLWMCEVGLNLVWI
jgi:hypothetical protein